MNNISKCLVAKSTNMSNFHPLEGVCRGSETKLQERNDIINKKKNNLIVHLTYLNCPTLIRKRRVAVTLTRHTKGNNLKKSW